MKKLAGFSTSLQQYYQVQTLYWSEVWPVFLWFFLHLVSFELFFSVTRFYSDCDTFCENTGRIISKTFALQSIFIIFLSTTGHFFPNIYCIQKIMNYIWPILKILALKMPTWNTYWSNADESLFLERERERERETFGFCFVHTGGSTRHWNVICTIFWNVLQPPHLQNKNPGTGANMWVAVVESTRISVCYVLLSMSFSSIFELFLILYSNCWISSEILLQFIVQFLSVLKSSFCCVFLAISIT